MRHNNDDWGWDDDVPDEPRNDTPPAASETPLQLPRRRVVATVAVGATALAAWISAIAFVVWQLLH